MGFVGGTRFEGRSEGARLGASVADAGDLDGDGRADLVFGAPGASIRDAGGAITLLRPGEAVAVFGRAAGFPGVVPLSALAPGEGAVLGETAVAGAGFGGAVAGGGDLDGDGRDDLLLGAPLRRGTGSTTEVGAAHAVGGDAAAGAGTGAAASALALAGGRTLVGESARTKAGAALAIADLDGDGRRDALIGVPGYSFGMEFGAGGVAVAWGGPGFQPPGMLGLLAGAGSLVVSGTAQGMAVVGAQSLDGAGSALATGDVNGDGIADAVIGAPNAHVSGPLIGGVRPGAVHVVFGGPRREALDLGDPALSVRLTGAANGDLAGAAVAVVGDVNGDGIGDLLVGAPGARPTGRAGEGAAYLVFGRTGAWPAEIALGGSGTVRLVLGEEGAALGAAVSAAGDVNGDGRADFLVGAPGASPGARQGAGEAFLVMGRAAWGTELDLAALGLDASGRREGYVIGGAADLDAAGSALAALGDRNGDGIDDIAVGAPGTDGPLGIDTGAASVIYGGTARLSVLDMGDGVEDGRIPLAAAVEIDPAANAFLFATPAAGGRADGTAAAEVFLGGDGPDILTGNGGEDSFIGGLGDDRITGGAGPVRVEAGPGADVVKTGAAADLIRLGDGDDTALSGEGNDTVFGEGGRDVIKTSLGNDWIDGGDGPDEIFGWRGRDTIFGGPGDDVIRGDFDEDRIEGGPGNDRLLGGSSRDTFVFRMGFNEDRLLDYNPVLEKLDFSGHTGVDGFADLTISQVSTNVVILDGFGGRIVLAGVDIAQISAGDFIF